MPKATIGQIARASGVAVETIRYYERAGLLPAPARSTGGYRLFPDGTVARLHFIQRAKRLGFTLDEVQRLLSLADNRAASSAVRALAAEKLKGIEGRLRDLQRMRDALAALISDCDGQGSTAACPIIHALADNAHGTAVVDAPEATRPRT
ncbi:heavy metal-responsive transcriptional regulator [Algiphilus sp.]|uniref:heavy metal-responsive transcriptional regulator n=1 Tax=Algiphilus sp. TaxID=1872431 RepID=UPI002A5C15BF|nr:heavy metal-responsive transcriptional regulator [Pseudomonadota bacterium]